MGLYFVVFVAVQYVVGVICVVGVLPGLPLTEIDRLKSTQTCRIAWHPKLKNSK